MLVETRLRYFHSLAAPAIGIGEVRRVIGVQLPFPRDTSYVARFLHQVSKSFFLWIENSEIGPVPVVVSARHDLHAGRRTEGLRIGMGETQSLFRQFVDLRRSV